MSRRRESTSSASRPDGPKRRSSPPPPRPSSSILLLSPTNHVLLMHRVRTSSSFASAHVFPGGNLSSFHENAIPEPDSPGRHRDGEAYRLAAIRETFEESGILLARTAVGDATDLLELSDDVREAGRKAVHGNSIRFVDWLKDVGGVPDVDGLIPFTRWITPITMPKRFTTQMYLYMLPLSRAPAEAAGAPTRQVIIPTPTHDGGFEHTAATFNSVSAWLAKARANDIILFPPQLYLMTLVADFLRPSTAVADHAAQRARLLAFLAATPTGRGDHHHPTARIPWADKVMSPTLAFMRRADNRSVLSVETPGPELSGSARGGDWERVVLARFTREGPREVEVRWRDEVVAEEREEERREEEQEEEGGGREERRKMAGKL